MGRLGLFGQKSTASINNDWERSGSRTFMGAFTTDMNEVNVRDDLGPGLVINAPHPSDSGAVVVQIDVEQHEDPSEFTDPGDPSNPDNGTACYWWTATVTYGPLDPLTHTITGNPVDQPIDFSFDWQVFEQNVDLAYEASSGDIVPVVNSAKDAFDPGVTREQLKGVMRVAWNSLTFNPAGFFASGNCINADVWNGFPIGSVKFSPPKMPQRLYSQFLGVNYYRLEAEFCFNPNDKGWNAFPIDRGFRALNGSGDPYKIFDINGQPVSQPALLDGAGNVLTDPTLYHEFNFQIYKSISFNANFPALSNLFS